jgi:hypothetical protein
MLVLKSSINIGENYFNCNEYTLFKETVSQVTQMYNKINLPDSYTKMWNTFTLSCSCRVIRRRYICINTKRSKEMRAWWGGPKRYNRNNNIIYNFSNIKFILNILCGREMRTNPQSLPKRENSWHKRDAIKYNVQYMLNNNGIRLTGNYSSECGVPSNFVRGVQKIELRTEDRENGDLGAVAP